ncbi:hypothetical protein IV203_026101 [Nitzschia inconspicua]|uniref:Uncharacterized protein n=1 Tax=Nitzschia inconspicua TaxID=303405 RepID=A0A9K3PX90_9STRA|nr:hypothetical protein IV203_026101 [Nitzschia inconspicua]
MDGHGVDDDLYSVDENSTRTGARSSELFDSTFKKDHRKRANEAEGSLSSTRRHIRSAERTSLPQAKYVTTMSIDGRNSDEFRKVAEIEAEEAFLSKVPRADFVGEGEEIEKKNRKVLMWSIFAILALLLIVVGVVVGLTAGTFRANDDVESGADPTTFDNIPSTADLC